VSPLACPERELSIGNCRAGFHPFSVSSASSEHVSLLSTPEAGYKVTSPESADYVHMLMALRDEKLGALQAESCVTIGRFLSMLEEPGVARSLVEDLELGTLNPKVEMPLSVRLALEKELKPDRSRAARVREVLTRHAQGKSGLVRELWPELYAVTAAAEGELALQRESIERRFFPPDGSVVWFSPTLRGAEGLHGLNIAPFDPGHPPADKETHLVYEECVRDAMPGASDQALVETVLPTVVDEIRVPTEPAFVLDPESAFMELIPLEHADEVQPKTLLLHEAELNRRYELVVTAPSGLLRYRTGDVLHVVGKWNGALPVVHFSHKRDNEVRLSDSTILPREILSPLRGHAHDAAFQANGDRLVVVAEPAADEPASISPGALDEAIALQNPQYRSLRAAGRVREASLVWVPTGTFATAVEAAASPASVSSTPKNLDVPSPSTAVVLEACGDACGRVR
jgi:hypothetical protein